MKNSLFYVGLLIAILTCTIDQIHKWYMIVPYGIAEKSPVEITPFFNLVMVWNEGMSFGMLSDVANSKWILISISVLISIYLSFWLYKTTIKAETYALGLVIGGAVGNVIDRLNYGAVADFFDAYIGNYHWPAFNIADSAICAGALLLVFHSLRNETKKDKQ